MNTMQKVISLGLIGHLYYKIYTQPKPIWYYTVEGNQPDEYEEVIYSTCGHVLRYDKLQFPVNNVQNK